MRYQYVLLQRRAKMLSTSQGSREVWFWYLGRELATGLIAEQTLEEAVAFAAEDGWQRVDADIAPDAALLKRLKRNHS